MARRLRCALRRALVCVVFVHTAGPLASYVSVSRVCADGTSGACGPALSVFVNSCGASACGQSDMCGRARCIGEGLYHVGATSVSVRYPYNAISKYRMVVAGSDASGKQSRAACCWGCGRSRACAHCRASCNPAEHERLLLVGHVRHVQLLRVRHSHLRRGWGHAVRRACCNASDHVRAV